MNQKQRNGFTDAKGGVHIGRVLGFLALIACAGPPNIDLLAQAAVIEHVQDTPPLQPLAFTIVGRTLKRDRTIPGPFGAKTFMHQWPGVYFRAAFSGRELYFRTEAGNHQILHITIDHQTPKELSVSSPAEYRVHGLTDSAHTVQVQVVTEDQAGPGEFGGFALPAGEHALPLHPLPRQIEFIGDSHTVGYGNTSASRVCSQEQIWASTDTSKAFGAIVANHLQAEYQVNAISGRGVVRNYNGSAGDTIPTAYRFVLFDRKTAYEGPDWHPQLIVIALGTNDFSTPLNPGEPWKTRSDLYAAYEAEYMRFVTSLRIRFSRAFFLLWATDGAAGEIKSEVRKVVQMLNDQGESRIHFVPVDGLTMTACDSHPSVADDRTIAERLDSFLDAHPELWSGK